MIDIPILCMTLAGYEMGTRVMGQNPQELSQVYSVPQQASSHIQRPVPSACQTEFNSSPFTTGLHLPPHLASGSLPPATSSPLIHQPQLNPFFPGPSTIPSQGVIKKSSTSLYFIVSLKLCMVHHGVYQFAWHGC